MKTINSPSKEIFTYSCGDFEASSIKKLINQIVKYQVEVEGSDYFEAKELIIQSDNSEKVITSGKFFENFARTLKAKLQTAYEQFQREMEIEHFQDCDGEWHWKTSEAESYGIYQSDFI